MRKTSHARILLALSLLAIAGATLTPSVSRASPPAWCVICGSLGGVDALLNLGLFMPLGGALALLGIRPRRALAILGALTLSIEALQTTVISGRDASLGDLLTNTTGGMLGFLLVSRAGAILVPGRAGAWRLIGGWTALWIGVQWLAAFTLVPRMPPLPFFGQVAHRFEPRFLSFTGQVPVAEVESVRLADAVVAEGETLRQLLERPAGAWLRASAIPDGVAPGLRSMVRVVGTERRDVLSLEQDSVDAVFGVRTGADHLRLRPYAHRVRGVFRPDSTGGWQRVDFTARYARSLVTVTAAADGQALADARFRPLLSSAWRLVMPMQTFMDSDRDGWAVSLLWIGLLVLPAGYWLAFLRRGSTGRDTIAAITVVVAGIGVGLAAIPRLYGLPLTPIPEWGAAAGFALLGFGLGDRTARARRPLGSAAPATDGPGEA